MTWLIACGGFHIGPIVIPHGVVEALPTFCMVGAGVCGGLAAYFRQRLNQGG